MKPLHTLTKKGVQFNWSVPHLFSNFDKDFQLETDATIKGLGAVLSQKQTDGKYHPVAYASRALSPQENHELETIAVVWAVSHVWT